MLKVLKFIGIVVLLGALVICGLAAMKPSTFEVKRSADIKAPPEKISAVLSDFRGWISWSPYEKLDPGMKRTYSGPDHGVGAVYEWSGNAKAGSGRMEIVEATATKVSYKLDFTKPFEAHNIVDFVLEPHGDSTKVTWSMHGPNPFLARVMQVFMSMDKLVGGEFEKGLASLKVVAEHS